MMCLDFLYFFIWLFCVVAVPAIFLWILRKCTELTLLLHQNILLASYGHGGRMWQVLWAWKMVLLFFRVHPKSEFCTLHIFQWKWMIFQNKVIAAWLECQDMLPWYHEGVVKPQIVWTKVFSNFVLIEFSKCIVTFMIGCFCSTLGINKNIHSHAIF